MREVVGVVDDGREVEHFDGGHRGFAPSEAAFCAFPNWDTDLAVTLNCHILSKVLHLH